MKSALHAKNVAIACMLLILFLAGIVSYSSNTPTPVAEGSSSAPVLTETLYLPFIAKSPPPKGINGRVTFNGSPIGGVALELHFYNGTSESIIANANTAADGTFSFLGIPATSPGQVYSVRYLNTGDGSRLWSWSTRWISNYVPGIDAEIGNFDIADVPRTAPPHGASVNLPYTFRWTRRPATPTDNYTFYIWA